MLSNTPPTLMVLPSTPCTVPAEALEPPITEQTPKTVANAIATATNLLPLNRLPIVNPPV